MSSQTATQDWYRRYYGKKGADRNDLRSNPGVLYQALACEASIVRAMRRVAHDPAAATVLDVGCGEGGDLPLLLRLRYDPEKITGIDILDERVAQARKRHPQMRFVVGDASRLEFADGSFDLVFESTMFATLPDNDLERGDRPRDGAGLQAGGIPLPLRLAHPQAARSELQRPDEETTGSLLFPSAVRRNGWACTGGR